MREAVILCFGHRCIRQLFQVDSETSPVVFGNPCIQATWTWQLIQVDSATFPVGFGNLHSATNPGVFGNLAACFGTSWWHGGATSRAGCPLQSPRAALPVLRRARSHRMQSRFRKGANMCIVKVCFVVRYVGLPRSHTSAPIRMVTCNSPNGILIIFHCLCGSVLLTHPCRIAWRRRSMFNNGFNCRSLCRPAHRCSWGSVIVYSVHLRCVP